MFEFTLPDVGEGLTEADILKWHVAVGDTVAVNQTLVEIETVKSVVELPSPVAGTIASIDVDEGDTAAVGTGIVRIDTGETSVEETPAVLVGPGPTPAAARTRHLGQRHRQPIEHTPTPTRTLAKPSARLLAKQLGVDLATVAASHGEVISRHDVIAVAKAAVSDTPSDAAPAEREARVPIRGVRKATAAAMTRSAFTAPHVTEFLTVDVTATMDLLAKLKADRAWAGVRLTPLVLVARALQLSVRRYPGINARWDEAAQEIVTPHYLNLGIAAATPRGLIVPNIRDADTLDLAGLAHALEDLVATARAGKTSPEQMAHGTITITNIGAFGVDTATPILNPGEAAILALGAVRDMPWVVDGQVVARKVTQLALSFDHRLVDGELGSRVLALVGRLLTDPSESFLLA